VFWANYILFENVTYLFSSSFRLIFIQHFFQRVEKLKFSRIKKYFIYVFTNFVVVKVKSHSQILVVGPQITLGWGREY